MKKLVLLSVIAITAISFATGCDKYDDSGLKKEIAELRERLSKLEAWCTSSQDAIDAVAILKEAVDNMNSVVSIDPFIDADGATGYVLTFSNKQTIKLYNGEDGDAFFGNVVVNDDNIVFTLADGQTFIVPRRLDYLCFTALQDNSAVRLYRSGTDILFPDLEYSLDGQNWEDFCIPDDDVLYTVPVELPKADDKVYLRNKGTATTIHCSDEGDIQFDLTGRIAASGNIMSLLDNKCKMMEIPSEDAFAGLFAFNPALVSAPSLPATKLSPGCYCYMFYQCTSLEIAPQIPAIELAEECCLNMFGYCTSLTKASELPAAEMEYLCYCYMFQGCTSLTEAPQLPATKMAKECYRSMFQDCISLTEAPALPATRMGDYCYYEMFFGCTGLAKAPELPATDLAEGCYSGMFKGCSNLTEAPALTATALANLCYGEMFKECTSLKDVPEVLPALEANYMSYWSMFAGCSSLTKAPRIEAEVMGESACEAMFWNCTSLTDVQDVLPATKLAPYCYSTMFSGCTSLTELPELPATELAESCYEYMYEYCAATRAPRLPATVLVNGCYDHMFNGSSNLNYVEVAFSQWPDESTTSSWLDQVAAEGTFVCPAALADERGSSRIPEGWQKTDNPVTKSSTTVRPSQVRRL